MEFITRLLGVAGSKAANEVDPEDTVERLSAWPGPVLIDVRPPDEYRRAHIDGARLIPLVELQHCLGELPEYRDIILVCRSGSESRYAAKKLSRLGYRAKNMRGGMLAWGRAGLPVRRGDPI
jgi:rhodanese-related sulfurtransferase